MQPTNLLYVPFVIPKSMAKKIKKIQRDFLWRGRVLEKKKKPTSNELVDDHKDKKKEGLSIKDLSNKIFFKKKLGICPLSIRHFWVNGIRDSLYKRIYFGEII